MPPTSEAADLRRCRRHRQKDGAPVLTSGVGATLEAPCCVSMLIVATLYAVDASKVPPSRFQKRKGSIYATPGSRDGHVDRNYATDFHEKHTQKGYGKTGGRN